MELEIGCGSGEFLCSLARRDRQTNFVGVEVKRKSIYEAVARASSAALENVVFLRADFRLLYPLLAPGSLDAVYLHFPTRTCARSSASIGSSAPVSYKKCTPPRHLREGSAL